MIPSSSVGSASEPTRPAAARVEGRLRAFLRRNTRPITWTNWLFDSLLAVVMQGVIGFPFVFLQSSTVWFDPLLIVPGALYTLAIVIRRWGPGFALAIVIGTVLLKIVIGADPHGQDLAIAIVVFTCAAYGTKRSLITSAVSAALIPAAVILSLLWHEPRALGWNLLASLVDIEPSGFVIAAAIVWFLLAVALSMCWLGGLLRRMQRDAQVARTKREVAEVESLRSREQLFVEQERNRIARDMHDVVAHSLAVVVAQADGGRYAMRSNPASGEETLTKIAEISREALVEVRGLLGQLRHSQPSGPQPGFADAPVVLERMRLAGLRIVVESSGSPLPLRLNADIALFRLVQEALTNSLRHGDPNLPTVIRIAWGPELRVEVENTCNPVPPAPRADSGHGLIGMRERIVMSGGTVEAGRIGDRFLIVAVVPTVPAGDAAPTRSGPVAATATAAPPATPTAATAFPVTVDASGAVSATGRGPDPVVGARVAGAGPGPVTMVNAPVPPGPGGATPFGAEPVPGSTERARDSGSPSDDAVARGPWGDGADAELGRTDAGRADVGPSAREYPSPPRSGPTVR